LAADEGEINEDPNVRVETPQVRPPACGGGYGISVTIQAIGPTQAVTFLFR
jgi:hypothetical protein